jgi:very-short-patch-repair endonuclease
VASETLRLVYDEINPFIGSEALANGRVADKHRLRTRYRTIFPDVYLPRDVVPNLRQRTVGAWLWTYGNGVVCGLAAAAMHGSRWIDDDVPVEMIWPNARAPRGMLTRRDRLLSNEIERIAGMWVTTAARTAFDLGRRGQFDTRVARLDALCQATGLDAAAVMAVARQHPGSPGIRKLPAVLELHDGGAESPKETWLRLLMIRAGYPRPRTQIPVLSPDGLRQYYLDMGWEDRMLAVEYDGDHHRSDPIQFAYDIRRLADIDERRWRVIRVAKRIRPDEVLARVHRAWQSRVLTDRENS